MYQIERTDEKIIVRYGNKAIYSASPDSWIIYRDSRSPADPPTVSRAKDLTDQQLLTALATAVELKDLTGLGR